MASESIATKVAGIVQKVHESSNSLAYNSYYGVYTDSSSSGYSYDYTYTYTPSTYNYYSYYNSAAV